MNRREGITIGNPPKFLEYENDTYKVLGISHVNSTGHLLYDCYCKKCEGIHERHSRDLRKGALPRYCPAHKVWNWSGLEREEAKLQRLYGISMQEFEDLREFQDNKCGICLTELDDSKDKRESRIDHCHASGEVRGLLCNTCNTGLGFLGDNIESLERALYYLKHTPYSEFKDSDKR